MTNIVAMILGVAVGGAIIAVVWLSRNQRLGRALLVTGAAVCLVVFVALNVSDWPGGGLAEFWRDHAIVAATLGTLLPIGVGYLAFEAQDARAQEALDAKIASAGRAGLVDHLVDVDVALALVASSKERLGELWPRWDEPGRPLRWLRDSREVLFTESGRPTGEDPRALTIIKDLDGADWRLELVDQAVRRVMAGIRDWAGVLGRSRDGQRDLVRFGQLRLDLLTIQRELAAGGSETAKSGIDAAQQLCRELAVNFDPVALRRPEVASPRSGLQVGERGV